MTAVTAKIDCIECCRPMLAKRVEVRESRASVVHRWECTECGSHHSDQFLRVAANLVSALAKAGHTVDLAKAAPLRPGVATARLERALRKARRALAERPAGRADELQKFGSQFTDDFFRRLEALMPKAIAYLAHRDGLTVVH